MKVEIRMTKWMDGFGQLIIDGPKTGKMDHFQIPLEKGNYDRLKKWVDERENYELE